MMRILLLYKLYFTAIDEGGLRKERKERGKERDRDECVVYSGWYGWYVSGTTSGTTRAAVSTGRILVTSANMS